VRFGRPPPISIKDKFKGVFYIYNQQQQGYAYVFKENKKYPLCGYKR